ncbi:hypothetical protein CHS0354_030641 [Potamilus streckersoni]|uniref:Uncharacterized protein n=1 Tax=Potamilus streckersoni TaxID=2493646 RepID=A0AAE0VX43_9BIVA|nr:hypothetical protein CHS0354_030641 [Potamilus streckersoni]
MIGNITTQVYLKRMWLMHVWQWIGTLTPIRQRETLDHLITTTFICCLLRCTWHPSLHETLGQQSKGGRITAEGGTNTKGERPGPLNTTQRVTINIATEKITTPQITPSVDVDLGYILQIYCGLGVYSTNLLWTWGIFYKSTVDLGYILQIYCGLGVYSTNLLWTWGIFYKSTVDLGHILQIYCGLGVYSTNLLWTWGIFYKSTVDLGYILQIYCGLGVYSTNLLWTWGIFYKSTVDLGHILQIYCGLGVYSTNLLWTWGIFYKSTVDLGYILQIYCGLGVYSTNLRTLASSGGYRGFTFSCGWHSGDLICVNDE